jgi:lysozyme
MNTKALFDAIRDIKAEGVKDGNPKLTQADVDRINRILSPPAPASRKVSERGIDLIHSFESLKLTAVTIGWGSTSDLEGRLIKLGTVWTRTQADAKFAQDLEHFETGVAGAIGDAPTTQGQFDAMTSLAYNIGLAAFRKSTLLRMHKAGDHAGAKGQFAKWVLNDGKRMNGLVRRRAAEAELYAS